jgi:hypothetical protein
MRKTHKSGFFSHKLIEKSARILITAERIDLKVSALRIVCRSFLTGSNAYEMIQQSL